MSQGYVTTPPARTDTESGTELTRFNALRHGVLSRYTVLPWEDGAEYRDLLNALVAEHRPSGPTEEHLVEELAGVLWRKRRLRLAEAAAHHHGLQRTLSPHRDTMKAALVHVDVRDTQEQVVDAIRLTPADAADELADMAADEVQTRAALAILDAPGRNDGYEAALATLRDDSRGWWADEVARPAEDLDEDEEPATPDAEGLRRFISGKLLSWFDERRRDLAHRPLIRDQAFGEALDPDKLEQLGRYEVHLDRKLERTLAMLLKLKDLRRPTVPG